MPIVKKLKFDLDGNGEETIVNIKLNSEGEFHADLPLHLKSAVGNVVSGCSTMHEAINLVNKFVTEYQDLKRTEKWVILIEFKRNHPPFINKGLSMSLNYAVAAKKQFGKKVEYVLVDKGMDDEFREIGNTFKTHRFSDDEGVIGGESLEIDFTAEKLNTIIDLHTKLEFLCEKLSEVCNSEERLMELMSGTLKLLG